ncbi:hypothetical protein [Edaphobacter flagellatus]|nr:hypothetical protein [Edaphobacter flagellatus]
MAYPISTVHPVRTGDPGRQNMFTHPLDGHLTPVDSSLSVSPILSVRR